MSKQQKDFLVAWISAILIAIGVALVIDVKVTINPVEREAQTDELP